MNALDMVIQVMRRTPNTLRLMDIPVQLPDGRRVEAVAYSPDKNTVELAVEKPEQPFTAEHLKALQMACDEMGADDTEWYEQARDLAEKLAAVVNG